METIGEKIKRLRKSKGLRQIDVALVSGITQPSYAAIERGETKIISIEVGKGISKALGEEFDDIFDIERRNIDAPIDDYKQKIEELNSKNEILSHLIETLKNEKTHIRLHLVMQMVSSYSFEMTILNKEYSVSNDKEQKERLSQKMDDVKRLFILNRDYYIKSGFLTQLDFDDHYKSIDKSYEYMPDEIPIDPNHIPW